ncbi:hypothetical protein C8J56DRAFT_880869 [Mycena floridula]|nr:hypothetical protein C8J56DRAFT_880869 [Mycena floridula]
MFDPVFDIDFFNTFHTSDSRLLVALSLSLLYYWKPSWLKASLVLRPQDLVKCFWLERWSTFWPHQDQSSSLSFNVESEMPFVVAISELSIVPQSTQNLGGTAQALNFYQTQQLITKDNEVWYNDGMVDLAWSKLVGKLSNFTLEELSTCEGGQASLAILYTIVDQDGFATTTAEPLLQQQQLTDVKSRSLADTAAADQLSISLYELCFTLNPAKCLCLSFTSHSLLHGLASSIKPHFFTSSSKSNLLSQGSTLSALLAGKHKPSSNSLTPSLGRNLQRANVKGASEKGERPGCFMKTTHVMIAKIIYAMIAKIIHFTIAKMIYFLVLQRC